MLTPCPPATRDPFHADRRPKKGIVCGTCMPASIHPCTCIHASIHPFHLSVHASIHPYIHLSIHPCMHARISLIIRVRQIKTVTLAFGGLRQEDCPEFQTNLGYRVRPRMSYLSCCRNLAKQLKEGRAYWGSQFGRRQEGHGAREVTMAGPRASGPVTSIARKQRVRNSQLAFSSFFSVWAFTPWLG